MGKILKLVEMFEELKIVYEALYNILGVQQNDTAEKIGNLEVIRNNAEQAIGNNIFKRDYFKILKFFEEVFDMYEEFNFSRTVPSIYFKYEYGPSIKKLLYVTMAIARAARGSSGHLAIPKCLFYSLKIFDDDYNIYKSTVDQEYIKEIDRFGESPALGLFIISHSVKRDELGEHSARIVHDNSVSSDRKITVSIPPKSNVKSIKSPKSPKQVIKSPKKSLKSPTFGETSNVDKIDKIDKTDKTLKNGKNDISSDINNLKTGRLVPDINDGKSMSEIIRSAQKSSRNHKK